MRSASRRGAALLIASAVLLSLAAAPVDALTLQRTWTAAMGTNGANGSVTLYAYTNGTGSIQFNLKALTPGARYRAEIFYGTCSRLGAKVIQAAWLRSSGTGTTIRGLPLTYEQMYWTWRAARTPSFAIRVISGTSIRCGGFTFPTATRVWVSGLGIDLPVIRGPSGYPPCNVAMYLAEVAQPREPGITYIFSHARTGMFLPLLTSWRNNKGASLIGRQVKVWTSDSYVSTYSINKVHTVPAYSMAGADTLAVERLWLQTSTGPNFTYPKLIVEAVRTGTVKTTYAASHPTPHPVRC
jgi:hypothetical protein